MNRASSKVPRARFTVDEMVNLTLDFYRRNYIEGLFLSSGIIIEGLFLSSGIIQNLDYTMEKLIAVARTLPEKHDFPGYIHLKTIPDASRELIAEVGRYVDRISVNVELPTQIALDRLAPEKKLQTIKLSTARIREKIEETRAEHKGGAYNAIETLAKQRCYRCSPNSSRSTSERLGHREALPKKTIPLTQGPGAPGRTA